MTQQATTAPSPEAMAEQVDAAMQAVKAAESRADVREQVAQVEEKVAQLRLKVADLDARRNVAQEQRDRASTADRSKLDKQWLSAQHDYNAAFSELQRATTQSELLQEQLKGPMTLAGPSAIWGQKIATVAPPQMDPFKQDQIKILETGAFVLLLPLVITFARRLWIRSRPSVTSIDLDSSPRLQRIEQAVEAIAIEVERIGEAQRFTTKLLSERQPEAVAGRIPPAQTARREPGTITPH